MGVPFVQIQKVSGTLGVTPGQNPVGILALIAPLVQGPSMKKGPSFVNMQSKGSNVNAQYDYGLIDDIAEYVIDVAGKPVVIVPQTPSTPGVFGTPTVVGTGTLAPGNITANAAFAPVDDFQIAVRWTAAGTINSGGLPVYQYSADARAVNDSAKTWSAPIALGLSTTISIPSTGVVMNLAIGATVAVGDYFVVQVTGPRLTDADVSAALTALGRASLPWEGVLIDAIDAESTTVGNCDTFLSGLEARGLFKFFIVGSRLKNQAANESEAAYLTTMTTVWGAVGSERGSVSADGGYLTSVPRGFDMVRKASIAYAARLMFDDVTTDAARTSDGNLQAIRIVDGNGIAQFHDENLDPGLDAQRLVTFRSFDNKAGVFITNPQVISTPGNDYQLLQQVRTMNRACELAYGALTDELSDSIFTDLTTGFIREDSAQSLEGPVNNAMQTELAKKVSAVVFELSRNDVLTPPTAILTGTIDLVMPVYVKGFLVSAELQRTITLPGATVGG